MGIQGYHPFFWEGYFSFFRAPHTSQVSDETIQHLSSSPSQFESTFIPSFFFLNMAPKHQRKTLTASATSATQIESSAPILMIMKDQIPLMSTDDCLLMNALKQTIHSFDSRRRVHDHRLWVNSLIPKSKDIHQIRLSSDDIVFAKYDRNTNQLFLLKFRKETIIKHRPACGTDYSRALTTFENLPHCIDNMDLYHPVVLWVIDCPIWLTINIHNSSLSSILKMKNFRKRSRGSYQHKWSTTWTPLVSHGMYWIGLLNVCINMFIEVKSLTNVHWVYY